MKPCGAAAASCPARDAKCILPEPATAAGRVRLAIVGESPGRSDLEEGLAFSGASSKMLARGLRTLGLTRQQAHLTNAVLCECDQKSLQKAAKACRPRLQRELAAVNASVVMPLGPYGLQGAAGLTKKPKFQAWRGSVTRVEGDESHEPYIVAPTLHPAFVMRARQWAPTLELDIARIGRLLDGGGLDPFHKPGHEVIYAADAAALRYGLTRLRRGSGSDSQRPDGTPVGFDVETVGLGPTHTSLVCFALSDGDTTLVVPWSKGQDGRVPWWGGDSHLIAADIAWHMVKWRIVTHNGPAFDHIVAARYGLVIGPAWEDTLLLSHAYAGHLPKNLAHVVTHFLDVPPWKQWDHAKDLATLWTYNARDTLYTIEAYKAMTAKG